MRTLEECFIKEFKAAYFTGSCTNIYNVPVPDLSDGKTIELISGSELYAVKGIEKEHYKELNQTIVKKLPSGFVAKRRKIDKVTRGFLRDNDGNPVYEKFPTPKNTQVVLSKNPINLPYQDYKFQSKDGYNYIDFVDGSFGREYMYTLPTSVLFKVHQTALVLSVKNMKNYWGSGFRLFRYGLVYLHVVPYKPNAEYVGSRVLCTKYGLSYKEEINKIFQHWRNLGIVVPLEYAQLQDGTNLAVTKTQVGYTDYTPVDTLALSDTQVYGESESNGVEDT